MWRETNVFGVYMSPIVAYMFAAGLIYAALRFVLARTRAFRNAWNPPLLEAGIFVCILGVLVVWF